MKSLIRIFKKRHPSPVWVNLRDLVRPCLKGKHKSSSLCVKGLGSIPSAREVAESAATKIARLASETANQPREKTIGINEACSLGEKVF